MTRVAALTSGRDLPSSRFRVRQHLPSLRELGFDVREHIPRIEKFAPLPAWPSSISVRWAPHFYAWQALKVGSRIPGVVGSWRSDITWLQRELLPARYTLERVLKGKLVFDVDDAIWLGSAAAEAAVRSIAARADVVLAGNSYLADWFSKHAREVRIVPTAVDADRYHPADRPDREEFVIGWTGSRSTLRYLESIEAPLRKFMADHPAAELLVIADRSPVLPGIPSDRFRFLPWSPEIEATALQQIDVGLMPLPDTDWARGKCSFKMLQYMASGVPVIVSPVGMNEEVLARGELGIAARSEADWRDGLHALASDPGGARQMGAVGRSVIEQSFSVPVVSRLIAAAFEESVAQPGTAA